MTTEDEAQPPIGPPLEPALEELLALSTLTLATCAPGGAPHAAPLYFAALVDPERWPSLYFFSEASSQHAQNLAVNPRAGAAIYPECWNWQEIRGLQMRGGVRPLKPGAEWERAWGAYQAKFPFVTELEEAVRRNLLYVFIPSWLRLVDNRRGFGFKQEWSAP